MKKIINVRNEEAWIKFNSILRNDGFTLVLDTADIDEWFSKNPYTRQGIYTCLFRSEGGTEFSYDSSVYYKYRGNNTWTVFSSDGFSIGAILQKEPYAWRDVDNESSTIFDRTYSRIKGIDILPSANSRDEIVAAYNMIEGMVSAFKHSLPRKRTSSLESIKTPEERIMEELDQTTARLRKIILEAINFSNDSVESDD